MHNVGIHNFIFAVHQKRGFLPGGFHHKSGVAKRQRGCYCEQKPQEESQEGLSCKSQYP